MLGALGIEARQVPRPRGADCANAWLTLLRSLSWAAANGLDPMQFQDVGGWWSSEAWGPLGLSYGR